MLRDVPIYQIQISISFNQYQITNIKLPDIVSVNLSNTDIIELCPPLLIITYFDGLEVARKP